MNRPWTGKELELLRQLHGRTKLATIGKLLGRTKGCVASQITRQGMTRRFRWTSHGRRVIRMMHARGHSCDAIAKHLGCSDTCVLKKLRKLGLPPNGFNHTTTKRRRLACHHIAKRYDCNNWAEVRWLHERRRTEQMGVPDAWNVSEAKLLLAAKQGAISIEAATKLLGLSRRRTCGLLRRLWERGLLQRQMLNGQRRNRTFLYAIPVVNDE